MCALHLKGPYIHQPGLQICQASFQVSAVDSGPSRVCRANVTTLTTAVSSRTASLQDIGVRGLAVRAGLLD